MVQANSFSECEVARLQPSNQNESYEIPDVAANNNHKKSVDLKVSHKWRKHLMLLTTLGGVLFGIIEGFSLRPMNLSQEAITLVSYPGELFMRLLKLLILPLIISSLITATASANIRTNGRIAVRTLIYFALTTFLNALLGISLVLLIHPGITGMDQNSKPVSSNNALSLMDNFLDLGRNLFSDNLFQASIQQVHTVYVANKENTNQITRNLQYRSGTNTLGIVVFCLVFGMLLSTIGPKRQIVIDFFGAVFEVTMKMVTCVIWLSPIGISSVIAGKILTVENLTIIMSQLMWFILTVVTGVLINHLILVQVIYYVFFRRNPFKFYCKLIEPLVTGAATASSAAALPVTFRCLNEKVGVDTRITQFVLPIGCNINFNGAAIFVPIATIFLAQMSGTLLGLGELLTILLTTTIGTMSLAAVPSASIVLIIVMLSSINVPTENVALLLAVDWLLDRLRTTNNILGNCYACAIVEHLSEKELKASDAVTLNESCFNETKDRLMNARKDNPLSEAVVIEMR